MRLIFLALLFVAASPAQHAIQGVVRDEAGASIPTANVKLISDGKLVAETNTTPDGIFKFDSLVPGTYEVAVIKTRLCISQGLSATVRSNADTNLNVILKTPENANVPKRIPAHVPIVRRPLLRSPTPVYPPNAKAEDISGTVTLSVLIDEYGAPIDIRASSGSSPFFTQAAIDAVRQWRYRAVALNCVPVQVETDVSFEFLPAGIVSRRDGL